MNNPVLVAPFYLHNWDSKESMIADFEDVYDQKNLTPEHTSKYENAEILLASYDRDGYEGSAFVLYRDKKDGLIYEVHESHCSCFGLEDQWKPEVVDIPSLKHRCEQGSLGNPFSDEGGFKNELKAVLNQLEGKIIRWIKIPGPGEFRSEGIWKDFDPTYPNNPTPWSEVKAMNFLPTKELAEGVDPNDS